ncbi:hypothetical protein GGH96_006201 [Coemansia sp. RSA 1972]|nr:hypothetical protein GGH96_006201 [Coemansia sp. RSA 1972]
MAALTCDTNQPKPYSGALRLSTGTVQCADPDLKRAALSELFDHCMTPIVSERTLCPSSSFVHERTRRHTQRARPLSAAPALNIELPQHTLASTPTVEIVSGLVSPLSPTHDFYSTFGCDSGADDEGGSEYELPQTGGTFANLRRKLYGGSKQVDVR